MEPHFPVPIPKRVERLLGLVPRQVRGMLATAFVVIPLATAGVIFLNFAAGDDPLLRLVTKYATLCLICVVTATLIVVIGRAVWVVIHSPRRGGKGDEQ